LHRARRQLRVQSQEIPAILRALTAEQIGLEPIGTPCAQAIDVFARVRAKPRLPKHFLRAIPTRHLDKQALSAARADFLGALGEEAIPNGHRVIPGVERGRKKGDVRFGATPASARLQKADGARAVSCGGIQDDRLRADRAERHRREQRGLQGGVRPEDRAFKIQLNAARLQAVDSE